MPTLHILSNPISPVNLSNRIDPFSISTWKFIHWMTRLGWNCIHYGVVGSEVDCKSILCLDYINTDHNACKIKYNENSARAIGENKKPGDMILCFYGVDNQAATEPHKDLKIIEPGIGYDTRAVFADYRVFTSYAQMHMFYGGREMLMSPSIWDAVIPNGFTPAEFDYTDIKSDYVLYFGRVIETKGINIAIQATAKSGKKLVIAGPGHLSNVPNHVSVVGPCNVEQRRKLMKNALAIIGPTLYVEPFGNMVVEGYLSGTPAITADWGGFIDTVVHGVTGYRCRFLEDYIEAINNIKHISNKVCFDFAMENFTDEVIHKKFDQYLKKLNNK